ncbi:m7GpppX diphosphatase [Monomorium pharaonis]|uniref:m7GpppX diphosphatase n=1 Tax=Monomorium pharaonis TaxID=307658 RepID=UPI00063F1C34|nr:m7GpppX diphosphatase [Monomorium pharaonis]XP_012524765.1 m7GpppX diphosphatase [Monomorium pharaonis]XP_012524766.1 m7GpppX diphosphatase [Monomorium pharaonis]XP_028047695.1 m7GpppX diphosphatase [Monomorium pharaonis]XP_028047696.1 m7GpppX diphosphatase [Monomorium pharaonis]XP_028047697.1 m7GpppX diphosphatase [Monomorium pharaonis]XP_028047698.1 m7GpppX diphosphatase [Monomorium pharaonis]XP_028047699.1 m7GpppX diphosphatase [Monomorium pharaonis]
MASIVEECVSMDKGNCNPPAKKIKLDDGNMTDVVEKNPNENDMNETELDLSSFKVTKVLQNNCARKLICMEGTFEDRDGSAVVLLEQRSFPYDKEIMEKDFFDGKMIFRKIFTNDIYRNYSCFPTEERNGLQATVIYPATQTHINKYKKHELFMIDETYELYQQVTLPYIESMSLSLEWITNILEHKAEQESIIYEDPDKDNGFVLVTDFKWDKQKDTLKLLALPFQKIRSLRELNGSHLPLLKNIRDAGTAAITKKFNISASQLRMYFHYQPSYYYLHIHFCYLMFEAPGIYAEKAHLLSTVIRNLELMSDYYTKAVLSYVVFKGSPLYEKFKSHGALQISTDCETQQTIDIA